LVGLERVSQKHRENTIFNALVLKAFFGSLVNAIAVLVLGLN